jgi:alanine-synthesizing transaminase
MEKNRLQQALEEARASGPVVDLVDTNFHRNDLAFPAQVIRDAMVDYLAARSYEPHSLGSPAARAAIAGYYHERNIEASADQVIVTASTSEAYGLLFNQFTEPGDAVALPRPGYPLFEYLADHNHLETRFYDLDPRREFAIDMDSLHASLEEDTRLAVLISPNNPTGQVADLDTVRKVVEACACNDVHLIADEVFSEFLYPGAPRDDTFQLPAPAALSGREGRLVFTLNGISKMFASPDLKLGWILVTGEPTRATEAVEVLEVANDMYLSCNSFSQFLLPRLFEHGRPFVSSMTRRLEENRRLLVEALAPVNGIRLVEPRGGIHCMLEIPGRDDEETAVDLVRRQHVYTHPGYLYGMENGSFLVLSFLTAEPRLRTGLQRLVRYFAGG